MSIVVNTNMSSLLIQSNLTNATNAQDQAMLRMSTGLKINSASDDAAGMAQAVNLTTTIRGNKMASQNIQIASAGLTTDEGTLKNIKDNLQRIRDLAVQGDSAGAEKEITQRALEINRLSANNVDFAAAGKSGAAKTVQVGSGTSADNQIVIAGSTFNSVDVSTLKMITGAGNSATAMLAKVKTALATPTTFMTAIDNALKTVVDQMSDLGAAQNRLSSAQTGLTVSTSNLTATRSAIQDADIAEESSNYIQANILKQASASLLTQANQAPSLAVNLV